MIDSVIEKYIFVGTYTHFLCVVNREMRVPTYVVKIVAVFCQLRADAKFLFYNIMNSVSSVYFFVHPQCFLFFQKIVCVLHFISLLTVFLNLFYRVSVASF